MRGTKTGIVGIVTVGLLMVSTTGVAAQSDAAAQGSMTTQPIELPAEIPEGIDSGTLQTPIGQARWVHLRGDETTLPAELFGLANTPNGYVVLDWDSTPLRLWRSPDLTNWTSEPLNVEARYGELSQADGSYWLRTSEPGGLWRSTDAASWEQVDLADLEPPGPNGYAWQFRPGTPAMHDGLVSVPFQWVVDWGVLTRDLPLTDDVHDFFEIEPGVYQLVNYRMEEGSLPVVRVEETDSGIRIVDHEDGTELKVLDGVSLEFVERLTSGEVPSVGGLGVVEDGALVEVELPGDMSRAASQALTVDDVGFVSYSLGPDGLVRVHRSEDGRDWIETDVVGDEAGEPTDIGGVGTAHGSVRIGTGTSAWTSTDGVTWEDLGPPTGFDGEPFASGWISGPMAMAGPVGSETVVGRIWYLPEEGEPIPIDTEMAFPASDCGGWEGFISSNTMFTSFDDECHGLRELWIITFDQLPA